MIMWRVGDHVRVTVSSNESRKGVVACVNDSLPRSYDILLFETYGNSQQSELLGTEELERVPSVQIQPLLAWETSPRLPSGECETASLRSAGADMFRVHDWRGAVSVYQDLLSQLERSKFFLFKAGSAIRLGRLDENNSWYDYGEIDPMSDALPQWRTATVVESSVMDESLGDSKFFISLDPRVQASTLLNLGRAFLNLGKPDEGISSLSYAIFVSCLVPEEGKILKTKSFFWRAKARLALARGSAALRDADAAHTLASQIGDVSLINECRVLINAAKSVAEENRKSSVRISRELMKICESHFQ